MLADGFRWMADERGEWLCINSKEAHSVLETLDQSKQYDVEIKQHRKGRSLNANRYYWEMAGQLARKLNISAQEVYKQHIAGMSIYDTLCMSQKAVDAFIRRWTNGHLGRFAETKESKLDGCTVVLAYYGSSDFDTAEMARLIDNCIVDCKEQGIEVISEKEKALLLEEWNAR